MRIAITQSGVAGLLFALFGVAGLWFIRDLGVGSALRMGPGYLPKLMCWLLIASGAIIAANGLVRGSPTIGRLQLRPAACIVGSIVAFALLIDRAGLVSATFAGVTIGALGGHEFRLREALLLSAGLAALFSLVFVYVLGLPIKIFPF
jgi:hypothetical protein